MSESAVPVPVSPATTPQPKAAAPATRSALMSAIKSTPTVNAPTVTAPTASVTEKPAPVEGAIRIEPGAGAVSEDGKSAESGPAAEPSAEPVADAAIDYAAKYAEIFDNGDLHESLHEKMLMAKIDGQDMPVTVKEALKGYMRRSDHSRAMNEVAQGRQQLDAERAQLAGMWSSFKDHPELAIEVFGERFGDAWLDKVVATRHAAQADYDNAVLGAGYRMIAQLGLDPATAAQDQRVLTAMAQEKQRLDNARKLEAENRALKRRQAELDAQQHEKSQQAESETYQQRFQATVKRFADAALKAEGLTLNSVNRAELQKAVAQVIIARNTGVAENQRDYTVSQDVVREAAQILAETKQTPATKPTEEPLPARPGMGAGTGLPVKPQSAPQTRAQVMANLRK